MSLTKPDLRQEQYFPTLIFSYQVEKSDLDEFNSPILSQIYSDRVRDPEGIQRSNFRQLGGWHSHNNLHKEKSYERIVSLIDTCSQQVSEKCGYSKKRTLKIGTMWSIVNPPGSSNKAHIHPGSLWSGVYYVQTPENCGEIEFVDPRTQNLMSPPTYIPNKRRPKSCWTKVFFTPAAGKLLIFPSWLYHSVAPNLSTLKGREGERVIVSFNLVQKVNK